MAGLAIRSRSPARTPLGERRLELRFQASLGLSADDAGDHLAVTEEDHRRDREHLVASRGLRVLVGVETDDLQRLSLGVDLLEDRMDDTAGTAPGSPEVDEHGAVGIEHVGLEV